MEWMEEDRYWKVALRYQPTGSGQAFEGGPPLPTYRKRTGTGIWPSVTNLQEEDRHWKVALRYQPTGRGQVLE